MQAISGYSVTLSKELFDQLHAIAADLEVPDQVPLEWLVAGLICDTMERFAAGGPRHRGIYS